MQTVQPSPSSAAVGPEAPRPQLEVIIQGAHFPCADGDIIGREGTVGALATAQMISMSRRHLAIQWNRKHWCVFLLPTARNTTLLDGQAMTRETPYELPPGDYHIDIKGAGFDLRVTAQAPDGEALAPSLPPGLRRLRQEFGGADGLLRLIAENVADLIAVIDQNGKRVWNNAAYFTCLGYSPVKIHDSYSMAEVHPDDLPLVKKTFEESMADGIGRRLEYRMRHLAGHWVYLESQGRVVESTDSTGKYLVLVARDVTERRHAEQQARERVRQLTERTATLAEFTQSPLFQDGELERCFALVTEAAVRHFGCARAGVWLIDPDGKTLRCKDVFEQNLSTHGLDEVFRADSHSRFFTALRAGRCLAADDALSDERLHEFAASLEQRRVTAFLAARIGLGNEVLGMLCLERVNDVAAWSLEDESFAASLADTLLMSLHARRRAEAFAALQDSQRQIAQDLAEASSYVRSLLPPPLTGAVESEWRLVPCTDLGGDGFGHYWLDENHLAIYLFDSVGHGVSASLLTISVMNILRSGSLPQTDFRDPASVLRSLNHAFQMDAQNDMFFTIWYGVYDKRSREIVYSAAAHPPAVLLGPSGPPVLLGGQGLMIGATSEPAYENARAAVPASSQLYVYSDGAFEMLDSTGTPWSFDAFLAELAKPPCAGLSKLDEMHRHAQRIHGHSELPDDFSIMRLTFH
jgi:PAS domain S-box-containing protein